MIAEKHVVALNALLLLVLLIGEHVGRAGAGTMLLMEPEVPLKKCRYTRSYDMFQAQCNDIGLQDIPPNLQSGIEVLDARVNRIRELRNDSLSKYTSLRFLYLQDNFLQIIAEYAFEPTYYLEVLDLGKNGLLKLPKSLFQLQSLRNLYLNNNQLGDEVFEVDNVRSPLQWLQLAKNRLTRLPQLKPLVTLTLLNVSYNEISRLTVDDIAPMCSLSMLDLVGNPVKFTPDSCECHELKDWMKFRKIKLNFNLDCPASWDDRCANQEFSNRTLNLYNTCLTGLRDRAEARKARSTWIWIASCLGVFMGCIFVALCCMHKRDRGKRRQLLKEQQIHAASNPNTEQLLNKDPNHEQS